MRFMISAQSAMAKYTDQLTQAGVLLETDGYTWLIEVSSTAEAAEWATRAPFDQVDVHQ
jgi:hypothetical protein